ncbi:hypothetical protein ACFQ21_05130 [Ohtaekwangia kribbensis]|uniref:Transcriptional regulator n=1 Tax=Ohtaekwangia kribbensis TaxID=688913 RepID=A0ABW3JYQ2_9BACT
MFDQIKNTLDVISKNHAVSFKQLAKNTELGLLPADVEKLKTFLIDENIVQDFDGEGNQFGRDPRYSLTTYGTRFLREMKEFEVLDEILKYLVKNKTAYLEMQYICRQINVAFSPTYAPRLEHEGMVASVSDKSSYAYIISKSGENWILVSGGYRHQMTLQIEQSIKKFRATKEKMAVFPQTINNIQAENYFSATNSTIDKQGIFNEIKKEEKKNNWLETLSWIAAILVSLTVLYAFFKPIILDYIK